jgi:hypothetical protein
MRCPACSPQLAWGAQVSYIGDTAIGMSLVDQASADLGFVVRSVLVPALISVVGRASGWPGK